jgi:23S rRNA (pseudouridine1915-N3)-methyltransferase
MRMSVVAVGQKMPTWVREACEEYLKRMPREHPVQLIEVKPASRTDSRPVERLLEEERERIQERIPAEAVVIALDERGTLWTTRELAQQIDSLSHEARDMVFLIGGPDGLHSDLKKKAAQQFGLSRLTLPHGMARVVLCEQLYRAISVLNNHPYHRD